MYIVDQGKFETGYGNMPRFGLAASMEHVPAIGRRETARSGLETNQTIESVLEMM